MMIVRLSGMLGQLLAGVRSLAGLTQGQLADRSGVAGSQISKYELLRVTPDIETTRKLLDACGWRLVMMLALDAETYDEREAVIEAARRFRFDDLGHASTLDTAVDALAVAEHRVREGAQRTRTGETVLELVQRLRDELTLAHDELRTWRAAGEALSTVYRSLPAQTQDGFVLCDHPRLVPRLPCAACAPRYAERAGR